MFSRYKRTTIVDGDQKTATVTSIPSAFDMLQIKMSELRRSIGIINEETRHGDLVDMNDQSVWEHKHSKERMLQLLDKAQRAIDGANINLPYLLSDMDNALDQYKRAEGLHFTANDIASTGR